MEYYRQSLPNRKLGGVLRFIVLLVIVGFGFYYFLPFFLTQPIISPIPEETQAQNSFTKIFAKKKIEKKPEELGRLLQKEIKDTWKNYSIYVKDYNSDFTMGINESVIYVAASVNKLPILAALYYLAQSGEVDLDKSITLQSADIQDYGTGVIRYDPPGTSYTIKTLALLMIQKSDNTAAFILANHVIGLSRLQELVTSWGLIQTNIENNKTSNKDIGVLFEKIVNNKIANAANTNEMLSFLKDTDFEDRLPAQLPASASVFHKIGTEVRTIHDVGIVTDSALRYYVGILTTDVISEDESVKLIARLSKTIFDFMQ